LEIIVLGQIVWRIEFRIAKPKDIAIREAIPPHFHDFCPRTEIINTNSDIPQIAELSLSNSKPQTANFRPL